LKRFGLTIEDYIDFEKSQNGVCAICKNPEMNKRTIMEAIYINMAEMAEAAFAAVPEIDEN
jgi:hypothetical protein